MAEIWAHFPVPREVTRVIVPSLDRVCPVADLRRVREEYKGVPLGIKYLGQTASAAPESATTRIFSETVPKLQVINALGV